MERDEDKSDKTLTSRIKNVFRKEPVEIKKAEKRQKVEDEHVDHLASVKSTFLFKEATKPDLISKLEDDLEESPPRPKGKDFLSCIVARSNPDLLIGGADSFLRGNEYIGHKKQIETSD